MFRSILKLTLSIILLPCISAAQETDSVTLSYRPTGIRVGTDLIAIGRSFGDPKFTGWEVNADIDFDKYFLAVDYGQWSRALSLPAGDYSNSGSYFRIGPDVNLLLKNREQVMVFFGLRYGQSKFNEDLNYVSTDSYYGDVENISSNTGVTGRWGEVTSGLRAKIWKGLWGGYTIRFKFRPSINGAGELIPYDMPGYGLAFKNNYWGFNYQIFWRFGLSSN